MKPEAKIERECVRAIERAGGTAEKFKTPGRRHVPDRICSLRRGVIFFIEFKAPGKKPRPGQVRDHERRHARGFRIYTVDNANAIVGIIDRERRMPECVS